MFSHHLLSPYEIVKEHLTPLQAIDQDRLEQALELLFKKRKGKPIRANSFMKKVDKVVYTIGARKPLPKEYLIPIRKVVLTPSAHIYYPPEADLKNRVLSRFE
jgi:hypothetical protein